jgi:two-component system sensor histidine kinase/response regulator
VSSEVGTGSTFGFDLTMPIVALTNPENTDFNYLQVMVMDEETTARYLLAEQLRKWGTNVIEASSPEEARSLLVATARREEGVEILFYRSLQGLVEQERVAEDLRTTLGIQTPMLVQLYDDEGRASLAFDVRLRRPVHPTDLQQLLAHHADEDGYAPEAPLIEDAMLPPPSDARILVADDEPMNRQIVVHALEQFGYAVDVAQNGQQVLDMLDQKEYQIVLLDMQMPVMDGLTATKHIRERTDANAAVPIIAFTASIEREKQQLYLDRGVSAILGKPFSLKELRQTLEEWLKQSSERGNSP